MTLRDLTTKQVSDLVRQCDKDLAYWKSRPEGLGFKDHDDVFKKGYNSGVRAVLEILMPK